MKLCASSKPRLAVLLFSVSVISLACGSRKLEDMTGGGSGGSNGTGGHGTGGHGTGGSAGGTGGSDGGTETHGSGGTDGSAPSTDVAGDDATTSDSTRCPGASAQPALRPQAVACPATNLSSFLGPDAGSISCATTADCQAAAVDLPWLCYQGMCIVDQCLTDGDCTNGMACGCASDFGGNAMHTNRCVLTQCRVDADCGQDGACSPSHAGPCSSLTGYYCHSSADTCSANADCTCDPDRPACLYQPTLGHWACQARIICSG